MRPYEEANIFCHNCKTENPILGPVGRRDSCTKCGNDLRCCKNCSFFDLKAANECRETQAERVLEKDRANFCDFFRPTTAAATGAPTSDPAAEAKSKLAELFGKKA